MKQPEIGNRVAELRLQKGMTQEKLAELCEVSTRTIQRIESGEVDPRAFTINNLSEILEYDFRVNNNRNDIFWLTVLHLSSIICIAVIPLLIWSFKKNKSSTINKHGWDVLKFQILMTFVLLGAFLLLVIISSVAIFWANDLLIPLSVMSIFPICLAGFICIYQGVVNTARVLNDKPYKYPFRI